MTPNLMKWVQENRPAYAGSVLEIGSLDVNGNVRQFFPDALSYIGIDIVYGNNVDLRLNSHFISAYFGKTKFDTVICLETLEHDDMPDMTYAEIKKCLKPKGTLILSAPTIDFPYHHPPDYWRFTETGIKQAMYRCGVEVSLLSRVPDTVGNHSIIALGVAF